MTRIVIIEKEEAVLHTLQRGLKSDGVEIIAVQNSQEAFNAISNGKPDMVLLDVQLPDLDSAEVCHHLSRMGKAFLPFLILPARPLSTTRETGQQWSAIGPAVKPLDTEEQLVHLKAMLRHLEALAMQAQRIEVGDLVLDPASRQVWRAGLPVPLSRREFDLLELLARHAGQVLPKACIFEEVWGYNSGTSWEVVKVYINYLRTKLNAGGKRNLLHTLRGFGYVLRP